MKKFILVTLLLIAKAALTLTYVFDINLFNISKYYVDFDINGLTLGEDYTEEEVRATLIHPTAITFDRDDSGELQTISYFFRWGSQRAEIDEISHSSLTGLNMFHITSNRFKLFEGRVTVGDHIDKVTKSRKGKLVKVNDGQYNFYSSFDAPIVIDVDENEIITSLYFIYN